MTKSLHQLVVVGNHTNHYISWWWLGTIQITTSAGDGWEPYKITTSAGGGWLGNIQITTSAGGGGWETYKSLHQLVVVGNHTNHYISWWWLGTIQITTSAGGGGWETYKSLHQLVVVGNHTHCRKQPALHKLLCHPGYCAILNN